MSSDKKYTAILVKKLGYWLWFETKNVVDGVLDFEGTNGWGRRGAKINTLKIRQSEIVGRITSDELGYCYV